DVREVLESQRDDARGIGEIAGRLVTGARVVLRADVRELVVHALDGRRLGVPVIGARVARYGLARHGIGRDGIETQLVRQVARPGVDGRLEEHADDVRVPEACLD